MRVQPLRTILTFQSIIIAVIPFLVAASLSLVWLFRQVRTDAEEFQRQLAVAIASEVESYLTSAQMIIQTTATIPMDENLGWHDIQHFVDAQILSSDSLRNIYALSIEGMVMAVGLSPESKANQKDLIGIDLSHNALFEQVLQEQRPVWSDAFRSAVCGRLSVALAVPSPQKVAIGEIELNRLTDFLSKIALYENQIIFVIDQHGQIIADRDGRYTAQQMNIGDIPLVKEGLRTEQPLFGEFEFNQRTMIGHMVHTPTIRWHVLAAQPIEIAFRSVSTATRIAIIVLILALIIGLAISILFSKRLARRFESLTTHARRVSAGEEASQWPKSGIREFDALSADLEQMAGTLREREHQLSRLMSNLPGIVYRFTIDPRRRILLVSLGCRAITGYGKEELLENDDLCFQDLIHPEDNARVWEEIQLELTRKKPYRLTYRIYTAEKRLKWVSDYGQGIFDSLGTLVALEGFMTDVTETKTADEKIRVSELKYQALFEESKDTVFVSTPEGRYLDINPAGVELLGYASKEEMLALDIPRDVYARPEDRRNLIRHLEQSVFVKDYEVRLKKKDGTIRSVLITATAMLNSNKQMSALRGVIRDITGRKFLEEQLRQSQKMEAIGALAGGIAHDFNNLLTPIIGYADIIQSNLPPDSPLHDSLQQVTRAATRAKELVQQILTFSRQSERERRPVQIHLIIKEALHLLRASIPRSIEIRHDVRPCGYVLADPAQMHQVIMNLCTNAYHAMRETGGLLGVTVKEIQIDPDTYAAKIDLPPGTYVLLEVSDTGTGMDETTQARIFEPYFTTKKEGEGTGLGLSVVHGIVKYHEGHINVYSEPGKGTTFNVYLPRAVADDTSAADRRSPHTPGGTERLLIVDDDKSIIDLQKQMFTSLGYEVTALAGSTEALLLFERRPDGFDLVITDMTMPNMNGAMLAKRLLEIRKDIPIILCTGFSDLINEAQAKSIGIRHYVMKPIIKREIARTVRFLLDQKSANTST
ncbi:MAG: PAS domain S-box protein [Desulfatitalea sp.]